MNIVSTHPSDHRMTNALKAALSGIDAPGWAVVCGDRHEMAVEALRLHYEGVKLVHVQGGDTPHGTDGHPDHRTRDAISMLARLHFVANVDCRTNLAAIGITDGVFVTGNPGLDEVVRFARTLDPNRKREGVCCWYAEKLSGGAWIEEPVYRRIAHDRFLEAIASAQVFVTNSSAGLLEAPILGTPVHWVDDRQTGRSTKPYHHPDGKACEVIADLVREHCK